jgi:hypothetical protein
MSNNLPSSNQSSSEFKNRFDVKTLILVMMMILLATVIILWNPEIDTKIHDDRAATLTAQVTPNQTPNAKLTPYPVDILDYPEQTNGVVLGAVVIVLIVLGGTLGVIQRRK